MKKIIFILIASILFSIESSAYEYFEPYSTTDWVMESAFVLMVLVDWRQTKDFRADGKKESNPILGEEPSQERIDTLIPLGITLHALVTWWFPKELRGIWNGLSIHFEWKAISHNCNVGYCAGLNVNFRF